jgi:type VI secretion system secreted protein VgrG
MADELKNAFLSLATPLGPDKLFLRSFSGTEAMSQLFSFQLDMLSTDKDIKFDDIIGQNVTVGIKFADGTTQRFFNGFISRFSQLPNDGRLAHYQAEMVPWLWFLTRTADCFIFQEKTVPQILHDLFNKFGFGSFVDDRLQRQYKAWEYCVQYRETASNFAMRLMEQEGIFFFFTHQNGKHQLVMGDTPAAHKPCPNQSKARFTPQTRSGGLRDEDTVFTWRVDQEMRPGKCSLSDFNFKTPSNSLLVQVDSKIRQGGNDRFDLYDYPGEYDIRDEGDTYVSVRMEEEEVPHVEITGQGNCRSFCTGFKFDLTESDRSDQNGAYVFTSVTHNASESGTFSSTGEESDYTNFFTCIPAAVAYRPPRSTPRPLVQGSQTAIVVGPKGEEIYTDKFGRVKVQFHWDRVGNRDEHSSCFIRVSQPWAGKGYGGIWIPRIGQEVIVDFLEGDPDQPIITGRVYNAEQMPPYQLPDNQTQGGFKSHSSKGGDSTNFNEIRFEDKKGSELLYVHAELNKTESVEANSREYVGHDRLTKIWHDEKKLVKNDLHLHIEGCRLEKIDKEMDVSVGSDGWSNQTDGDYGLDCSKTMTLHAQQAVIAVDQSISINGPGGFVKIDPSGVTISGTMVLINSGGVQSPAMPIIVREPEDPDETHGGSKGS